MIRTDYQFHASTSTINFSKTIELGRIGVIINITTGTIIFSPASTGSLVGNTLTLSYNTSAMADTDKLQILYNDNIHPITNAELRASELRVALSDDTIYGDGGPIQQHEKESPNWPIRELLTYDSNIATVLGSQNLVNNSRLKVEDAFAPEQRVSDVMRRANDEVIINLTGQGTVTLQMSGTWAGTQTFYASIDGQNWVAIYGQIPGTAIGLALTTTANGIWRFHVAGLLAFKVQMTTYSSGTARAMLISTPIGMVNSHMFVTGSQTQLLQQRASTYELTAYDTSVAPSMGVVKDSFQIPDPWYTGGYYYIGDTCTFQGQVYQCILAHSAATAGQIPTNATYWQVDQRQTKSLVTNLYSSPPNASRVRIELDLDAYQYRLIESQMMNQQIQIQNDMIFQDYEETISQDSGCQYGKKFSLGQSSASYYTFTEIR